MSPSAQHQSGKKGILLTVFGLVLLIALVVTLFVFKQIKVSQMAMSIEALREHGVYAFEKPRLIKPFNLVDQNGEAFDKSRLQDKWSLVFFGFTFCPDICPTTMAFLNQAVNAIDDPAIKARTQVIMVSVDPARDTPEQLSNYVPYFNKDFIGLTGEFIDVFKFASNLNAPFQKVKEGDSYSVDHAGYIFFVNPKGDYQGFIKPPFEPESFVLYYKSVLEHNKHL